MNAPSMDRTPVVVRVVVAVEVSPVDAINARRGLRVAESSTVVPT